MRQRLDHGLAVPVVVGPVVRIEPGHLFVVPDLGAHLAGVLLQDAPLPAVQVESSGVVRSDAQLVAQVGLVERRVAAPEHEAAGDLDLVAAHIREILLRRGRIGLGHAAHALPREPSDSLLASLLAVSLPIMLLVALAALLMLIRTLRPLKLLTRKTRQLAEVDFAAPDALDRLEPLLSQGLPLERRDELGQLARAYAHLGGALATNIRNLMEATASKERMEGELSAAREIQMGILPPPDGAPEVCGFRASAFLDPAKEVGGDMYDFFVTSDGRRALVLGDVSGKGVPAALFMSMTVTLVRYALGSGLDPAAAMSQVNAMLEAHNPGNMFVTLFLALYDPQSGELSYANGGHCPPYIIDAASDAPPRMLDKLSGPLVGVIPDMEYTLFTETLKEQETCLLFTDGVTEAMNGDKELYGEARLQDFLAAHRGASPRELLTLIFSELVRFRGEEPQSDDITMLAFCRTHSASVAQPASPRTSS